MMQKPKIWALALILIAAGAVQAEAQSRSGLVSVANGSRFQLQGSNLWVRLYGIETCDLEQRAFFNGVGWPCGIVAAGWLTQITLGYEIKCIDEGSAEYATFYGRCFLPSGEDIAGRLREGAKSYALMSDLGFPAAFKLPRFHEGGQLSSLCTVLEMTSRTDGYHTLIRGFYRLTIFDAGLPLSRVRTH
ncbi:hypothetical protein [Sinorhizobium meliloti]|uniref:hypothetical protein n=1 Tax=Rhizobium meliloti TaxID=382 RepID=UPI0030A7C63C